MTQTNSGNEAKGTILGLEGMAVVPVIGGAVMTILMLVTLIPGSSDMLLSRVVVSLLPVGLAIAYVLLLVHKKPPNYQRDSWELYRAKLPLLGRIVCPCGLAFNAGPENSLAGPRPGSAAASRVAEPKTDPATPA